MAPLSNLPRLSRSLWGGAFVAGVTQGRSAVVGGDSTNGADEWGRGGDERGVVVSAGLGDVLALRSDGTVVAWGLDADGETECSPACRMSWRWQPAATAVWRCARTARWWRGATTTTATSSGPWCRRRSSACRRIDLTVLSIRRPGWRTAASASGAALPRASGRRPDCRRSGPSTGRLRQCVSVVALVSSQVGTTSRSVPCRAHRAARKRSRPSSSPARSRSRTRPSSSV